MGEPAQHPVGADAVEVLGEDPLVAELLAGTGGREARQGHRRPVLVGHHRGSLAGHHVGRARPVAELLLAPPQDLLGQPAGERLAQQRLLLGLRLPVVPEQLPLHGHPLGDLEHLAGQERHPRLQPERHADPVGALQVEVVQDLDAVHERLGEVGRGELAQVVVSGEQLVGALPGQHHLDVLGGELGEEVVRDGRTDQRRLVALGGAHHVGQHRDHLVVGVDTFEVLQPEVRGDDPGRGQVGAALRAGGEGAHHRAGLRRAGHHRGHDAGVEPAGEEDPERDVGHHPLADGLDDGLPHRGQRLVAVGEGRADSGAAAQRVVTQVHHPAQSAVRGPDVPGRELLDVRAQLGCEGGQLGGHDDAVVDVGPVERLHPEGVATQDHTAVGVGDAEGVHPEQPVRRVRPGLGDQVEHHLGVRAGAERPGELLTQHVVVVDLAVGDHPPAVAVVARAVLVGADPAGHRLGAAGQVDDGEPGVAQPGGTDLLGAGAVGPAVAQRADHRLTEAASLLQPLGGRSAVVDGGDSAHAGDSWVGWVVRPSWSTHVTASVLRRDRIPARPACGGACDGRARTGLGRVGRPAAPPARRGPGGVAAGPGRDACLRLVLAGAPGA
ncbi:hypothetical protein NOCARDAX2BIS_180039 [Nocardioides sp. AX2bis]|nr:hypothetical protein NOCARDAX2BIS_180039 [Nocardioides sp. AX2bis]